MCPPADEPNAAPPRKEDCVPIETNAPSIPTQNGQQNGESHLPAGAQPQHHSNGTQKKKNPYGPRYSDFLSNTSNWSIIESTLRGESSRGARRGAKRRRRARVPRAQRGSLERPEGARIPSSEARIPAPQARILRARRRAREHPCLVERQREHQRRRHEAVVGRPSIPVRAQREYQRRRPGPPSAPYARENPCLVVRQREHQRRTSRVGRVPGL